MRSLLCFLLLRYLSYFINLSQNSKAKPLKSSAIMRSAPSRPFFCLESCLCPPRSPHYPRTFPPPPPLQSLQLPVAIDSLSISCSYWFISISCFYRSASLNFESSASFYGLFLDMNWILSYLHRIWSQNTFRGFQPLNPFLSWVTKGIK